MATSDEGGGGLHIVSWETTVTCDGNLADASVTLIDLFLRLTYRNHRLFLKQRRLVNSSKKNVASRTVLMRTRSPHQL